MSLSAELWKTTALNNAFAVLIFYEFLITLDQEVSVVWRKRSQVSKWLFVIIRYSTLSYSMLTFVPGGTLSCRPSIIIQSISTLVAYAISSVLISLRAYAMSGRNLPLSCLVLMVSLVPVVMNTYNVASQTIVVEPTCLSNSPVPIWLQRRFTFADRITTLFAEVLVLALTWRSSWSIYVHSKAANIESPFVTILIRDGTLYFLAMGLIQTFCLINIVWGDNTWFGHLSPGWSGVLLDYITPLLLARFLLNLQQAGCCDRVPSRVSRFSVNFRIPDSIIGDMGEPVQLGPVAEEGEHDGFAGHTTAGSINGCGSGTSQC